MKAIFLIPNSNVIRFVRQQNNDLQTTRNRLLYADTLNIRSDYPFYTIFDYSDFIRFQFISNRGDSKYLIRLYSQDGIVVTDYSSQLSKVYQIDEYTSVYQLDLTCEVINEGAYYFRIDVGSSNGYDSMTYYSEPFKIGDYNDGIFYKKLQYTYSETDGIYYDDENPIIFECRVKGLDLQDCSSTTTATVYSGYDNNLINLNTTKQFVINVKCDPIPLYFAEILDLAFAHQYIWINGQQFCATEDSSKYSRFAGSNMFEFVAQIAESNYENYYELQSTGLTPMTEHGHLKISETGFLKTSENGLLNIN